MNHVIEKILSCSKTRDEADFLPNLFGNFVGEAVGGTIPVVLFGAGSAGGYLCQALRLNGLEVRFFCDNDLNKIGSEVAGCPVISLDRLRHEHSNSLILVSASHRYAREIREQLLEKGFADEQILVPSPDLVMYYTSAMNLYWSNDDLMKHAQQFLDAYELLSDHRSQELFIQRTALWTGCFDYKSFCSFIDSFADLRTKPSGDLFTSPRNDEDFYYFNSDFITLHEDEVLANVGALRGDCALEFVSTCNTKRLSYKGVINFEPDPENYLQLLENTSHCPKVRSLPFGLWSHRDRLYFSTNPDRSHQGAGSLVCDGGEGGVEVEVASLDELLPDSEISYIKMDIEGAEQEALLGAANTIRRNRPKLAICVYHKPEDIFKIPLLINEICPGYRFYLRHHCTTYQETVLFAVP